MLGSMPNVSCPQSADHSAPQQHLINNRIVQDQCSSNSSISYSDSHNNHSQILLHHTSAPFTNGITTNQACSSNCNNTTTQFPMFNYPYYTPNCHHQPMPLNIPHYNPNIVTSNELHPTTMTMTRHQLNYQQCPNNQNIDLAQNQTSSSCSSSPTTPTSGSTSSTNTNSIISNVHPTNAAAVNSQIKVRGGIAPDSGYITTEISQQARRFAETRYAFPPFIIKFKREINESSTIKYLSSHYYSNYDFHLNFAGHRLKQKRDLLLFVNDRESFSMLYDVVKWPASIETLNYEKILPNHLPPQFSLVLKNVPTDIKIDILCTDIKNIYPDVMSAYRISNKNQQPTTLVRIDINNVKVIEELLGKKFISINNLRFGVMEYLAPAKVLICSKCYQIGHFRSTCKSTVDYCRTCALSSNDISKHKENCDKKQCCIRCKGPHDSNDVRCPDVKTYRAVLTKSLLASSSTTNHYQNNQTKFYYNEQDYPLLNMNQNQNYNHHKINNLSNSSNKRIDELYHKMNKLEVNLNRLLDLNNDYADQLTRIQQVIMNHNRDIQLQQIDSVFQLDFVSQFIFPVCQVMIEVIPVLVKQNTLNDKTLLCPSLSALCAKLANDLSVWTNKFLQNEDIKLKLINDFNPTNQQSCNGFINNKAPQPPSNQ
ncbi:unnamed protein product [Rotaria sp. Silwood2]|nr:unnamed protein product [Rotaria sp. Silwood2]